MEPLSAVSVYALHGGGTSGADKNLGFVQKGGSMPTKRKDGSALQNEDYVKASGAKADFPFVVGGVEFTRPMQKAFYDADNKRWLVDFGDVVDSTELVIKYKDRESLSQSSDTQSQVNIEFVKAINGCVYTQDTESNEWNIIHNMGKGTPSSITLFNNNVQFFGGVYEIVDDNSGIIHFAKPVKGQAIIKF